MRCCILPAYDVSDYDVTVLLRAFTCVATTRTVQIATKTQFGFALSRKSNTMFRTNSLWPLFWWRRSACLLDRGTCRTRSGCRSSSGMSHGKVYRIPDIHCLRPRSEAPALRRVSASSVPHPGFPRSGIPRRSRWPLANEKYTRVHFRSRAAGKSSFTGEQIRTASIMQTVGWRSADILHSGSSHFSYDERGNYLRKNLMLNYASVPS